MASVDPQLVPFHKRKSATEFEIDVEKRIVFARFAKKVRVMDIRIYAERLRSHPEFDPQFSEIVDLREVEELNLDAPDFLKLADEIDCFSCGAWRAFVVHNSVQNHAARMHKILRTQGNIRIFSSVEEAQAWIESRSRAIR
jgi:hypothetical protein